MIIRKATKSDTQAIIAIDPLADLREERSQHIRKWIFNGNTIVALADEEVVGYAVFAYTFYSQGFIAMLNLKEAHRRKGVGTALISFLENNCKTAKLFSSTNDSNKPMQALMNKMAFKPSGIIYNLDDGDPELVFFKQLNPL